jgi:hypothetical protein
MKLYSLLALNALQADHLAEDVVRLPEVLLVDDGRRVISLSPLEALGSGVKRQSPLEFASPVQLRCRRGRSAPRQRE